MVSNKCDCFILKKKKQINKTVTLFLNVFKIYGKENTVIPYMIFPNKTIYIMTAALSCHYCTEIVLYCIHKDCSPLRLKTYQN